MQLIILITR